MALAYPDLGHLLADEADADGPKHVPGGKSDTREGGAVDTHAKLRQARQLLDTEIRDASHVFNDLSRRFSQSSQFIEVRSRR